MLSIIGVLTIITIVHGTMYIPSVKDRLYSDLLLRDIIDHMSKDLAETADSYLEYQDTARDSEDYDKAKEIPAEMPIDYEGIEALNPNPSIRDHEYLRHSSLVANQRLTQDVVDDSRKIQAPAPKGPKEEKSENTLPAYCTPPNPCPIGYTSANNCLENFENTAAFSRDFQASQDCMCDSEHMLDCLNNSNDNNQAAMSGKIANSEFEKIVEHFQESNPYFRGEKLPIAAKKGINIFSY
ncbi:neuroendocrine protein 7B2 [Microplitis demolitor]|uniref:neuroendocrine protein 7B2 n=1 Tax=Microplitis demolitor TaxID=69319 RepID=UPI0004CCF727|nr:neuroendocrine protein 7B2 [Microplitis demolitor]XP_008545657.1 neuroendocrine protein 7B2 [Microplitis demolitor]